MKAGADDGAGFLSRWGGYVNMGEYVSSVSMPEMSMPDMSMPDMSMPEMSIPEMSMPEMSMPSYEISMSLPDMPSVSMPKMSMAVSAIQKTASKASSCRDCFSLFVIYFRNWILARIL